jgi:hypothetical protein
VPLEIAPEPSDDERRAIVAALAADDAERTSEKPWSQAVAPARGDGPDEPAP